VKPQLEKCDLMPCFKGRIFSDHEFPRSKPAPDVYLAAGATVFGYSPAEAGHDAPGALMGAGAVRVFADMGELPELLN